MRKKLFGLFLGLAILPLVGCAPKTVQPSSGQAVGSSGVASSESSSEQSQSSSEAPSSTVEGSLNDVIDENITYDDFFNIENKMNFDIDISSEELRKLNSDYVEWSNNGLKSPIYRRANKVTITINKNGKDYTSVLYNVGVRMKGNTSRHEFIDENNNIYDQIHLKLSFEETFEEDYYTAEEKSSITSAEREAYPERKFLGLSKLDVRYNKNQDESYIREYYALSMYRDFGIMSQRANFSTLTINQDGNKKINYGLFLVEEPLTKTFIKRALSDGNEYIGMSSYDVEKKGKVGVSGSKYGQLYKASYGLGPVTGAPNMTSTDSKLFGVEASDTTVPPYELKSNTDEPDHTLIQTMINTLNNGTYEDIAKVVDLDYFYMFEAVSTVLGNPDDLRNNYNNYALYFRRTDGKMVIIPIDLDRVLGITKDYDPYGNAMTQVGIFSDRTSNGNQKNNLYKKTILSNAEAKAKYVECLEKVLASKWVTYDNYLNVYEIVKNHYQSFVDSCEFATKFSLVSYYNGNQVNMSANEYLTLKLQIINNDITAYKKSLENTGDSDNIITGCTNFYLTGSIDGWNKTTAEYKLTLESAGVYSITLTIPNNFECKIYCTDKNGMWLRAENGEKLHEGGANIKISDAGKTVKFIVDTNTGILTYTIS